MKKTTVSFISSLTVVILLSWQATSVLAQTAPTAPAPPTAPSAPSAPSAPVPPTAPTAPEPPTAPTAPEPPTAPTAPPPPSAPSNPVPDPTEAPVEANEPNQDQGDQQTSDPETNSEPGSTANEESPTAANIPQEGTQTNGQVGDVSIDTGNATANGSVITTGNNNSVLPLAGSGGSATVGNTGNGEGSTNNGSVTMTNNQTSVQTNTANVSNNLNQAATSGQNSASDNIGNVSIETGNANVSGTAITVVNTNVDGVAVAEFNIADDHVGDIYLDFASACIANCGLFGANVTNDGNLGDSTNTADATVDTNQATFQSNDATLGNTMTLAADSGHNLAEDNTGGDTEITTGDANVVANVLNFANNNFNGDVLYSTVNIFGSLVGDIIFPEEMMATVSNSHNGADSTNNASLNTNVNQTTNQQNLAAINNTVNMEATTGDNDLSRNSTGETELTTGDTSLLAKVVNIANSNIVGDTWLVLVNQAGQWLGKIMGADPGATYAGSEGMEFLVNERGEITVTNNGNGQGSTNNAGATQNYSQTLDQTNIAQVNNTLNLSANTGGNSASDNTGGTNTIHTGDANIMANILNFVNNNVSHNGRLFVTVVNVFGSWMGDLVTPGTQKELSAEPASQLTFNTQPSPIEAGRGGMAESPSETVNDEADSVSEAEAEGVTTSKTVKKPRLLTALFMAQDPTEGEGMVEGISDPQPTIMADASTVNSNLVTSPAEATKKMVNINLAWLLLLAPPTALFITLKRRMVAA